MAKLLVPKNVMAHFFFFFAFPDKNNYLKNTKLFFKYETTMFGYL